MRLKKNRACARRARGAGGLLTLAALIAACAVFGADSFARPKRAADAASVVGAWQATLPNGLRVATISIVPAGEGLAGAFVGYDYDRRTDGVQKPDVPPKVTTRTGAVLTDVKLEGDKLTFKMYLRHPSPPPGMPPGFDISGEIVLKGADAAELRMSAPQKTDPLVMKLTRD
ncbi:MAG TPA: hypothetical protein VGX48_00070 [Pyrinomonadaceae bacterium]|jgi:hypothetical protein|nr:hypothetical protein [Pyrinomonadaceae bacterium]